MKESNKRTLVNRVWAKIKSLGIKGFLLTVEISTKINAERYKLSLNDYGEGLKIDKNVMMFHPEKISLGKNVLIEHDAVLHAMSDSPISITIGDNCMIYQHTILQTGGGTIKIGSDCMIKPFCVIHGLGGVVIGNYVLIASSSAIIAQTHVFSEVSTPIVLQGDIGEGIIIEDDVWIGYGVKILGGVTIGTGSVIGAGAVVTKDIPPFSVAAGVPAKVLRSRKATG